MGHRPSVGVKPPNPSIGDRAWVESVGKKKNSRTSGMFNIICFHTLIKFVSQFDEIVIFIVGNKTKT
ncbi:hypothetical protein Fmac_029716 [Flemingia macrophylla]|uniref:Uncharacterized protein n=1 Tax=Flemingia macrophylla TaxID=520843 RepID=A0ABD1LB53_9FABA